MNELEANVDEALAASLSSLREPTMQRRYREQEEFLYFNDGIGDELLARMLDEYEGLRSRVHRNHIPGVRKCGNVGYRAIQEHAPTMDALYRSPSLLRFVSELAGEDLVLKSTRDEHACALYSYSEGGDRMCYHYDHCGCEHGASYSLIIGLINRTQARFEAKLHKKSWRRRTRKLSFSTDPGHWMFFCGSKIWHAVTPIAPHDERVVLSLAYVKRDKHSKGWRRMAENAKDAALYFGLPALFQRNLRD